MRLLRPPEAETPVTLNQLLLLFSSVQVCIRFSSFSTRSSFAASNIMGSCHVQRVSAIFFLFAFKLAASAALDRSDSQFSNFQLPSSELAWLIIGGSILASTMVTMLCCIFFWWQKKRQNKKCQKEVLPVTKKNVTASLYSVTPVIRSEDIITFVLPIVSLFSIQ